MRGRVRRDQKYENQQLQKRKAMISEEKKRRTDEKREKTR